MERGCHMKNKETGAWAVIGAVVGTLITYTFISKEWSLLGAVIGAVIGYYLAHWS